MPQYRASTNLKTSYDVPTGDCLQVAGRSPSPADQGQNPPSISPHGKPILKVRLDDIRGWRGNHRGRCDTRRSHSRSRSWSRGRDGGADSGVVSEGEDERQDRIRNGGATPYNGGASAEAGSQRDTPSDPRDSHRPGGGGGRLARAGRPGHAQVRASQTELGGEEEVRLRQLRQFIQPVPGDSGVPAQDNMRAECPHGTKGKVAQVDSRYHIRQTPVRYPGAGAHGEVARLW